MKLLIFLFLFLLSSISLAGTVSLTSSEKTDLPKNFLSTIDIEFAEARAYKPSGVKDELISFGESFYLDGYVTTNGYMQIKCKVDELLNLEKIIKVNSLTEVKECFLNTFSRSSCYKNANLDSYKQDSNKFCHQSLGSRVTYGLVNKEGGGTKRITKNYKLWKEIYASFVSFVMKQVDSNKASYLGQRANATAGQCASNLIRDIDFRTVISNSCTAQAKSCSKHLDCCSGVCSKASPSDSVGVCSFNYTCYKEIPKNDKCGTFSDGFINSHCKGESVCLKIDYNSSDINECSGIKKSCSSNTDCCSDSCVSGKCVEQSKCLECSQNGEAETTAKPCCPGLYKSIKGKCIPDFPPLVLPVVKNIIQNFFSILISNAYADEDTAPEFEDFAVQGMTETTIAIKEGFTKNKDGITQALKANCVPGVNCNDASDNTLNRLSSSQVQEIEKRTADCLKITETAGSNAGEPCFDAVAELRKGYLAENSDDNSVWDREKYKDEHNAIAITSKTYSDVNKCEFNSFNDTWRDMSNAQRNAELVVRGFEYVYTGAGTQDYWVNKNGKNIYSQAQEIATRLRKNRSSLIKKMQAMDIDMACQCIAIFGVGKFSDDKKAFFNSEACSEQRAGIASMNIGNVDGSSQSDNDIESEEGEISEVDSGATGISHEAILVDWLRNKYEFQMERFTLNQEVEESMANLVQFTVEETEWEKGKMAETELYKFTVRKMSGWFKVFIVVVAIAVVATVVILTGGAGAILFSTLGVSIGSGVVTSIAATFVVTSLLVGLFGKNHGHHFNDVVRKDWHCINWLCTHKDKDLTRYYVGPHFKNYRTSHDANYNLSLRPELKCDVRATSGQCLKNVHLTGFNDEARFLIDIKNPLFVDYKSTQMDTKHISNINKAFNKGIEKLKKTYPGSRTNVRFLRKNFLSQEQYMKVFTRDNGEYIPELFSDKLMKRFIEGVKKYSKCTDLVDCGASSDYKDDIGFGYLFEVEQDIEDFAAYVYQHHFHWPSLSASNFLGYPLMAQRAYLETISYNIKLVGSFAAAQGSGYGDAYFRYLSDWNTRRSSYDSLVSVNVGSATKNVKYSKEFLNTFNKLDFSVGDGIAAFDTSLTALNASSKGGTNSFESAALTGARNKASQALTSKKISDNYKKQTKGNSRSAAKLAAQISHLNSFGAPLNNSGLSVGGSDLGNTGPVFGAGGSLAAVSNTLSKTQSNQKPSSGVSSAPEKSYNGTQFSGGNNSDFFVPEFDSRTEGSQNVTSKNIKASGMSQEDIDRMLDATNKNTALKSSEDDNVFTALSKAYKRNYDVFFERKSNIRPKLEEKIQSLDDSKKSELKNLLDN